MSYPSFPEIDCKMTRESALNMILSSIAMEELALSHIINAESEKLQYFFETLDRSCCKKSEIQTMNEILAVNQSATRLLETVTQNQILLKNKIDSVLHAMPAECCECEYTHHEGFCAVFRGSAHGEVWHEGCSLSWTCESVHGNCIAVCSPRDSTKITLAPGCYTAGFAVNMKCRRQNKHGVAINLRKFAASRKSDVFTYHYPLAEPDIVITAAEGGIVIDSPDDCGNISLSLELVSPESVTVERAVFSIVKI